MLEFSLQQAQCMAMSVGYPIVIGQIQCSLAYRQPGRLISFPKHEGCPQAALSIYRNRVIG